MIESRWALWLLGWAVAAGLQAGLYLWQRRTRDATAVDAGWGISLALQAALYGALAPGGVEHRALIASMAGIESLRVASVVLRRLGRGEDARYRELRERWRARRQEQLRFAVFFQAQALLAAGLSVPFLLAAFNGADGLEALEWAGAALWVIGSALGWLADRQLAAFKADPANRGRTMRGGLWRYSRHPNYFFQSVAWVAYALVALAAPYGWIGLLAPAVLVYLILFVTGVPPAEESSLASRGDDYRRYQRETSVFVPWFPRGAT
jgi:steroid 5-alpha reductase family enzyme